MAAFGLRPGVWVGLGGGDHQVSGGAAVLVAGAGVFGTAVALALARTGAQVTLADQARLGDNASGAAAGMIAPVFEALLDPVAAGHLPMLRGARDLWPDFIDPRTAAAFDLRRAGAVWLALPDDPPGLIDQRREGLAALGAVVEPWTRVQTAARLKGLDHRIGAGLFTPEDWRLAPVPALAALQAEARAAGARHIAAAVVEFSPGRARLSNGERLDADLLVAATGAAPAELAPELARLSPIKGHILRFSSSAGAAMAGPSLRCRLGYASGGVDGLCVGATMEAGLVDRSIDPAVVETLMVLARTLSPSLAAQPFTPMAAVRAASPDGLPLVGRSAREGVWVAAGARRNGWLLAPLVARMIVTLLCGGEPGPYAELLDPRRFASV